MSFTVNSYIDLPPEDVVDDVTEPDPVATQPHPPGTGISPQDAAAIRARLPQCAHCGGWHDRACPRVRSMRFHPSGALARVEFWAEGAWSDAYVLWPEDLVTDDDTPAD